MFKIEDGRTSFWQWDLNQRIIVEDDICGEIHFCNRTDDCALVCRVYESDGKKVADVPNILLQTAAMIHVYAYVSDGDEKYTRHEAWFTVIARTKPADYIYTETELYTVEEMLEEALQAAKESGDFKGEKGDKGDKGDPAELSVASPEILGGVQPVAKTEEMTQSVGVDETGALWTTPSEGGDSGGDVVTIPTTPQIDFTAEEEAVYFDFTQIDGQTLESQNYTSCYVLLTNAIQEASVTTTLTVSVNPSTVHGSEIPKAEIGNFSKQTSTKIWACFFDLEKGNCYWQSSPSGNIGWKANGLSSMPATTANLGKCIRRILIRDSNGIPVGTNIKVWMR